MGNKCLTVVLTLFYMQRKHQSPAQMTDGLFNWFCVTLDNIWICSFFFDWLLISKVKISIKISPEFCLLACTDRPSRFHRWRQQHGGADRSEPSLATPGWSKSGGLGRLTTRTLSEACVRLNHIKFWFYGPMSASSLFLAFQCNTIVGKM